MSPLLCCHECGRICERVPSRKGRCEDCAREMNRTRYRQRVKGGTWLNLKQRVLRRDGNRCTHTENGVRCTATEQLEVHHINGDPMDSRMANLEVRCFYHHRGEGKPW